MQATIVGTLGCRKLAEAVRPLGNIAVVLGALGSTRGTAAGIADIAIGLAVAAIAAGSIDGGSMGNIGHLMGPADIDPHFGYSYSF
jgi:hypothetical protein